jgi:hypothetical protein
MRRFGAVAWLLLILIGFAAVTSEELGMEVRVVEALPSQNFPEADYVHVHTYADPGDDTVTLATIERIVDKTKRTDQQSPTLAKRIKTLIMRKPMSADVALDLATSYAERKGIPVVYADRG